MIPTRPLALALAGAAALTLASPAAALTLDLEFEATLVGAFGDMVPPLAMGDRFHLSITLEDRSASPVDWDGAALHPVSRIEAFVGLPGAIELTPLLADPLGWGLEADRDIGSGPRDTFFIFGGLAGGDLENAHAPAPPEAAGLTGTAFMLGLEGIGVSGQFDGDGPEQALKLDEMTTTVTLQFYTFISVEQSGGPAWVVAPEGAYMVQGELREASASAVPVPAAGLLLPAALGGLALVRRRRG